MSLLCLDCGNTRLKWGLNEAGNWLSQGAVATTEIDSLFPVLAAQPRPARAIACNVAGPAAQAALLDLAEKLGVSIVFCASRAQQCGVNNGYDEPLQLGADRWAALIAAHSLQRSACLVVLAGTATTIDLLDAVGNYCGGLILPGIAMMRAALAGNTALLPAAGGSYRELPRNTADAIASGCLQATAGAISRMYCHAEHGTCLISGGAASGLLPLLGLPHKQIDKLVLEGLVCMAQEEECLS